MISTFVLLTIVGGVCRLGLNWVVRRKLGVSLGLPPILALAFVVLGTGHDHRGHPMGAQIGVDEINQIQVALIADRRKGHQSVQQFARGQVHDFSPSTVPASRTNHADRPGLPACPAG